MKIIMIGAGNLATCLGKALLDAGHDILQVYSRTQESASALAGMLGGTFVSPYLYILPGFVGAGLLFAGISGWCGMAKLLAGMPWNRTI